ncbi:MAG: c-type cytochrome [Candidatus Rokuibacteriota bacterium]
MWPASAVAAVLVLASPGAAQPGDAERGKALYQEKCVLCHGGTGAGWDWTRKVEKPPVPVPDLATAVPERDDRYLFTVVKDGGEGVGRSRFMPPFGFQLTDEEVWHLVAYMRSLAGKTR